MEVETALERLSGYRGVQGCIALDAQGLPLKSTLDVRPKSERRLCITQRSVSKVPWTDCHHATTAIPQESVTKAHASLIPPLLQLAANMLRELDPNDQLTHLRLRSAKQEVMIAAGAHPLSLSQYAFHMLQRLQLHSDDLTSYMRRHGLHANCHTESLRTDAVLPSQSSGFVP